MKAVYLLFLFAGSIAAQTVGVDECACQPSVYTMTLSLGQTCENSNIESAGVEDTGCVIEPVGQVPVSISNISIAELDQRLETIGEETVLTGPFLDGATFDFTSFTVQTSEELTVATLPRVFQTRLIGTTEAGEEVSNTNVILFTNNCSVYPVLTEGMQVGWIVFVSFVALHSNMDS
jgi:hypothetical protein